MIDWYNRYNDIQYYLKSISPKQLQSKKWLAEELANSLQKHNSKFKPNSDIDVWLLGGWFGYPIIDFINKSKIGDRINSYMNIDMDPLATSVTYKYSQIFGMEDRVKVSTSDVSAKIEKLVTWGNKIVINSSSEHMPSLPEMVNVSTINHTSIFVFQSNDLFDEPDHSNCVRSAEELVEKNQVHNVYFKGGLQFDNYTRYMVIGSYNES